MVRVTFMVVVLFLFLGARAQDVTHRDRKIREDVLTALADEPRLGENKPLVSVSQSSVRLQGQFNDLSAKVAAEQLTLVVPGVLSVQNEIRVRPLVERNDDAINENTVELFEADPILSARPLVISVQEAKIRLTGKVVNNAEKKRAARVAARATGAVDLVNGIEVAGARALPGDQLLKRRVEARIYRNPLLSPGEGNRVRISVKKGVVTLKGVVESLTEYTAATREAFSGGAASVISQLSTRSGEVSRGSKKHFATYPGEAYPMGWKEPGNVQREPAAAPSPEPLSSPRELEGRPRQMPTPTPTWAPVVPVPLPTASPTVSPGQGASS